MQKTDVLRENKALRVLETIRTHPGVSRRGLEKITGYAAVVVRYHTVNLAARGLIEMIPRDDEWTFRVSEEAT
jgi:predicted transcriptional regulator